MRSLNVRFSLPQIDAEALNSQIEEKVAREQQEKERDKFYGALKLGGTRI